MDEQPKPTLRDPLTGHFLKGTKGGPGNPDMRRQGELRKMWLRCVTPEHVQEVYDAVMKAVREGNMKAVEIWLDRTQGKASPAPEDVESERRASVMLTDKIEAAARAAFAEFAAMAAKGEQE